MLLVSARTPPPSIAACAEPAASTRVGGEEDRVGLADEQPHGARGGGDAHLDADRLGGGIRERLRVARRSALHGGSRRGRGDERDEAHHPSIRAGPWAGWR